MLRSLALGKFGCKIGLVGGYNAPTNYAASRESLEMPATIVWDNASQTTLLQTLSSPVTYQQMYDVTVTGADLANRMNHTVNLISLAMCPPQELIDIGYFSLLQDCNALIPPNMGLIVSVGSAATFDSFLPVTRAIAPNFAVRLRTAPTLAAARALLNEQASYR